MARDVAGDLTAAGGVADVNRVLEVQRGHQRGEVVSVGVHVVAIPGLTRTAMSTPIVGDAAVSTRCQKENLVLEGIGAKRPAMTEHHGLSLAPVLVIDLRTVFSRDRAHGMVSFAAGWLRWVKSFGTRRRDFCARARHG